MTRRISAIALMMLMCASPGLTKPKRTVQRGAAITIEAHFVLNTKIQAASLTWQAYHQVDPQTQRTIDEVSPDQKHMATSFHCDADVVANDTGLILSCKVPLDVADAIYYLTSISIKTDDSERTYRWQDQSLNIEVRVKGGERVTPPYILSLRLL